MAKKHKIQICFSQDQISKLRKKAEEEDRTIGSIVRQAVRKHFDVFG